jgi:hypothetical protein
MITCLFGCYVPLNKDADCNLQCDGEQPACKGCKKANVECLYERVIRPRYPGGKSL